MAAHVKPLRPSAPSAWRAHARTRVDSGASQDSCFEVAAFVNARFRRPELFRRITVGALHSGAHMLLRTRWQQKQHKDCE